MKLIAILSLFLTLTFSANNAQAKGNNFINLKVNTFPLLIGANDIEVDLLAGKWAFGANAYLLSFEDGFFGAEATLFGGQISYHFSGANNDGWMFTGKGQTGTIDVTTTVPSGLSLVSATGTMDVTILSAEIGYQWMWSTFNMQLRAGVSSYGGSEATVKVVDASNNEYNTSNAYNNGTGASITYTFGLAF